MADTVLMSRAELATRLGVAERTLRRILAGMPGLQCYRIGRRIRFDERDLEIIKTAMREPYPTVRNDVGRRTSVPMERPWPDGRTAQDEARDLITKLLGQRSTVKPDRST